MPIVVVICQYSDDTASVTLNGRCTLRSRQNSAMKASTSTLGPSVPTKTQAVALLRAASADEALRSSATIPSGAMASSQV
jgi:hypothetical protein